jgi:hypothetical protein
LIELGANPGCKAVLVVYVPTRVSLYEGFTRDIGEFVTAGGARSLLILCRETDIAGISVTMGVERNIYQTAPSYFYCVGVVEIVVDYLCAINEIYALHDCDK